MRKLYTNPAMWFIMTTALLVCGLITGSALWAVAAVSTGYQFGVMAERHSWENSIVCGSCDNKIMEEEVS